MGSFVRGAFEQALLFFLLFFDGTRLPARVFSSLSLSLAKIAEQMEHLRSAFFFHRVYCTHTYFTIALRLYSANRYSFTSV